MSNQEKKAKVYDSGTLAFFVGFGVFLCALGVFVLLAVFGFQGKIFELLRNVVNGLFGCLGFGFGILLIWAGITMALSASRKMPKRALIFMTLLYLCILALFNLLSKIGTRTLMDEAVARNNTLDNPSGFLNMLYSVFMLSYKRGLFGGAVGMLLAWPLWKYLGNVLAMIILCVVSLVCALFITHFDFAQLAENMKNSAAERRQRKEEERAQEEQQRLFLEQQEQMERNRRDLSRPAYVRQRENQEWAQQQAMRNMQPYPAQNAPMYPQGYGAPVAMGAQTQMGFAPLPQTQPYMNANPMPLTGMEQPQQAELYDELIFPQTAEPTWKNSGRKKAAAAEEPRKRWVGNNYTLSTTTPPPMDDIPDGGGNPLILSRSKEEAVSKLEALRKRKQELTERIESDRLAAEEKRRNFQFAQTEPEAEAKTETEEPSGFAQEMVAPIETEEPAPAPAPAPAAVRDRHEAYRRPVQEEPVFFPFEQEEEEKEQDTAIEIPAPEKHIKTEYVFPPVELLKPPPPPPADTRKQDEEKVQLLENTLKSFGILAKVQRVTHGPSVTRFELGLISSGINVSKITNIAGNIALNMAANGPVRFEVPIKGTNLFGIEIPNLHVQPISFSEVLLSEEMQNAKEILTVALGKDVTGKPILLDIASTPHLLIAGQTGSGKSVCINTIIASLLYRTSPEDVRLILIDPKVVELQGYNVVPHLLIPVISDPAKATGALNWAVAEMMDRYHKLEKKKVKNIEEYNAALEPGEEKMARIVIVIDELADLMMATKKAVEESITRLSQLARASGIHLIVATQRPTVQVVTGVIKTNIPSRIAFAVSSGTDSRIILDQVGAEKLLGKGDMFVSPTGKPLTRVQGCFLDTPEIKKILDFIEAHSKVEFDPDVIEALEEQQAEAAPKDDIDDIEGVDERLHEAIEMVVRSEQASISMLQRRMKIGYARAGRLIDEMANRGIVSQSAGSKPREVLITLEEYERIKDTL